MHALLQLLSEYQLEVETRAFAHYSSSKYHRRQGVLWGIAASGFTAFASLAALAGGASKLGAFTMFGTLSGSSGLFVIVFSAIILFALATASPRTWPLTPGTLMQCDALRRFGFDAPTRATWKAN
jgi:hypothetical protein